MDEFIIFVDDSGTPTGKVGEKFSSHTDTTKKHLAFSLYLFNKKGEVMLTKRALSKKVWPGVWTNSVCGHPMPNEPIELAIKRRAAYELGVHKITKLTCVLPNFSYITPAYNGIIENEYCPVFTAFTADKICSNSLEVEQYEWVAWPEFRLRQISQPDIHSYWSKLQANKLDVVLAKNGQVYSGSIY